MASGRTMNVLSSGPGPFSTIQHNHVLSFNSGFVRLSAHGLQATFSGWSDWPEKGDRRRSSAPESFHLCESIMKLAPKAQS